MDQNSLVTGGANGLLQIMNAFRASGFPIVGIYLIVLTSHDGHEDRVIRLIVKEKKPEQSLYLVSELVRLRREHAFPEVDPSVRFSVISSTDVEASRVIEYAQRLGGAPVAIKDAMWKGIFIEYALVAKVPQPSLTPV